jgi:hypothetical protein
MSIVELPNETLAAFVIGHSTFFRHSSFEIRHWSQAGKNQKQALKTCVEALHLLQY